MKTLEEYEQMWDGIDIGELPPASTTTVAVKVVVA